MNPLPQLLLTVWTRKVEDKITFSSSIWEEEHSTFHSWPSTKVSSKSRPLPVILTWEVKISITRLLNTAVLISWRERESISETTHEPWEDLELNAKRQKEYCHLQHKPPLKSIHWLNLKISRWLSPGLNSKNSVWLCSRKLFLQSKKSWKIQVSRRTKSMKSSWSADQPEFQRLFNCSRTSSMERSQTNQLILMRQSLMVQPSKQPSWKVMVMRPSTHASCWMLLHCHWVLRLRAESWQN